MKQLTKLLTIFLMIGIWSNTEAQRMQFLNDTMGIDTRGAIAKGAYSLAPFFDKYGMWYYHDADPANNIEIGKTSENKIAILIEPKQSGAFKWDQYFAYINQWMIKGFVGNGRETPYGITRYIHFLPPGIHDIDATEKNYVRYQNQWVIAKPTSVCHPCAFSNRKGDYIELTWSGRGIEVIGEKMNTHGKVQIELDYQVIDTVDTYSDYLKKPWTVFKIDNLDDKQHTIRLTVLEDKYFVLHRFTVTNKKAEKESKHIGEFVSNHNEYHKAVEKAIEVSGKSNITRKGYYQVYLNPDGTVMIVQPEIEVK